MANRHWVAGGTGNYNSTTNWSATSGGASGASVPTAADDVFFDALSGVGTATINAASNCRNLNLTGFTGTLNFISTLSVQGTIMNFGLGTYTVTGIANLRFAVSMTITSNGTTYTGNVEFPAAVIYTLADNMSVSGNVEISGNSARTFNGNTFNILGNLTVSVSNIVSGTTTFVLGGTGTWNHTGTGVIRNNLTINTAGTITLGAVIRYNTGTLTYIAGTVVTIGSILVISASTTLNTNGIVWNDINPNTTVTITLQSDLTLTGILTIGGATTFTLGVNSLISANANLALAAFTFTLPANQTFKTFTALGAGSINGNTLTITEDIIMNSSVSGTTSIVYVGTGTWTASAATSTINNNFTINTAGTLTISGTVYKTGGTFTYTAGTINDSLGAVVTGASTTCNVSGVTWTKFLVGGSTTLTSDINAITFGTALGNSVSFALGGNTLNFIHLELDNTSTTTLPFAWVCQDITLSATTLTETINNFSISINGDITQTGTARFLGTTTLNYTGSGTWSQPTGTGMIANSLTINTAGTLNFQSGSLGDGIFTYTAGTFNVLTGSTLFVRRTNQTMNHGNIVWYDVILGNSLNSGSVPNITLNDKLICSNSLTLGISNTVFSGTDGTFDTFDLLLGSTTSSSTTTRLIGTRTYTVRRSLQCTQAPSTFPILINSTIGGSQAIFTLLQGSSIDVGFLNATDIDSSLGRTIYSYRGVFSNTLNWQLLPTDVKPATGVFVN